MNWKELNSRAYTPYSKAPRTCLVESSEGLIFAGVRIENISYPITISAIQSALFSCLSEEQTPVRLYLEDLNYDQLPYWKSQFDLKTDVLDSLEGIRIQPTLKTRSIDERENLKSLLAKAITVNSDFPVSCLLYTEKGYYEGVNIEVSDWSLGLCAERIALAKAISDGVTEFKGLSIHTREGEFSSPCGACRQVITEHLPLQLVKLYHADGSLSEHFTADLLPFSFSSRALKK